FSLGEFHGEWTPVSTGTLTGPTQLEIEPFEPAGDVPQLAGPPVDSLSFRLMHWLQYRNYGTHESLYANHTVDVGGRAVPRWYEIRDPGGTPYVYQQGTYVPDNTYHRWMGSIAADRDGNIALGYSISSSSIHPSIRYAGRRNVYLAPKGMVYVVGQYDARVIDSRDCRTALSEFRHLDRNVVFVGSFDQNDERRWVYLSAVQRPESPFEKR
ncbi:MAG: hypothetical protein ACK4VP_06835, partial [Nitrospira sp.]